MKKFFFAAIAALALSAPAFAQPVDAIDLHKATIRNLPQNVADWSRTTALTQVTLDRNGVTPVFTANWPDITPAGWDGALQYTIWLFVQDGSEWEGAGVVQMWRTRGSSGSYTQSSLAQHLTENWIRDGHWGVTHEIHTGDNVGIMVTAGNQRVQDDHVVTERSNVVLVTVQDQASYTFDAPAVTQAPNETVVAQAIADLQARGVDLTGPCGALKITNLVAYRLGPGYGLLHKAGGTRAVLKADGSCLGGDQTSDPEGFATDYVIERARGVGFDILTDAGSGNGPQWAGPEDAPDMVQRNIANVRPAFEPVYLAPPAPPVVTPAPEAPPATDVSSNALRSIDEQLKAISQKLDELKQQSDANTEKIQQQIDHVVKDAEKTAAPLLLKILSLGILK